MTTELHAARVPMTHPLADPGAKRSGAARGDWDNYWSGKRSVGNGLYSLVADQYRKHIIARTSLAFIKKHFARGQSVLHAGCGSGAVDGELNGYLRIAAVDISPRAIEMYRRNLSPAARLTVGDLLRLPYRDESFDGIYNLGVMEHFPHEQIHTILLEFRRVLRPDGRIVLFWPTIYSPSTKVLDGVHFVLNKVLRTDIKLHPEEPTRLTSRGHVESLLQGAGLRLEEYCFGIRDLFTQAAISARKTETSTVRERP